MSFCAWLKVASRAVDLDQESGGCQGNGSLCVISRHVLACLQFQLSPFSSLATSCGRTMFHWRIVLHCVFFSTVSGTTHFETLVVWVVFGRHPTASLFGFTSGGSCRLLCRVLFSTQLHAAQRHVKVCELHLNDTACGHGLGSYYILNWCVAYGRR